MISSFIFNNKERTFSQRSSCLFQLKPSKRRPIIDIFFACSLRYLVAQLLCVCQYTLNRELKKPQRRRREQRRLNIEYTFSLSLSRISRDWIRNTALTSKAIFINKRASRCGSRSSDNAEFGHFTLLFCRGQQRNVQRITTHVHCSAI